MLYNGIIASIQLSQTRIRRHIYLNCLAGLERRGHGNQDDEKIDRWRATPFLGLSRQLSAL